MQEQSVELSTNWDNTAEITWNKYLLYNKWQHWFKSLLNRRILISSSKYYLVYIWKLQ